VPDTTLLERRTYLVALAVVYIGLVVFSDTGGDVTEAGTSTETGQCTF